VVAFSSMKAVLQGGRRSKGLIERALSGRSAPSLIHNRVLSKRDTRKSEAAVMKVGLKDDI